MGQKLAHMTSTQILYPIGKNSITWPYLTVKNDGNVIWRTRKWISVNTE